MQSAVLPGCWCFLVLLLVSNDSAFQVSVVKYVEDYVVSNSWVPAFLGHRYSVSIGGHFLPSPGSHQQVPQMVIEGVLFRSVGNSFLTCMFLFQCPFLTSPPAADGPTGPEKGAGMDNSSRQGVIPRAIQQVLCSAVGVTRDQV